MAKPNIVLLPGIFASGLKFRVPVLGVPYFIWINPGGALTGELLQLQLAADGLSPGPLTWGVPLQPGGLFHWQFDGLVGYMLKRGWTVLQLPYDWRESVVTVAPALKATILAAFGQQPFVLLAHSMGGLVARAIYAFMVSAGLDQQVAGLVTMGAPHWGSWEPVRGFFGLPQLYRALLAAGNIFGPLLPTYRPDYLDVTLASWPGWYELLPWRDQGPLATSDPATAQALYQLATYAGGNPYVSAAWLASAVTTQHALFPAFPANRTVCIRGTGFVTPNEVNPPNPLTGDAGYAFTGNGDGQVPLDYATLPGAANLDVKVSHPYLPIDPKVWDAVRYAVQILPGVGPGA